MDYEKLWKELKDDLWEDASKDLWMGHSLQSFMRNNSRHPAQTFLDRMNKQEEYHMIKKGDES